ncbi:cytochrome P450 [Agromyces sp. Marseille-P2726]|uniref:cytochrome P450 n=1 Tax=Agromyces sp. Marseille-P2726 TaxID=2709132 RepID=UPI00156E19BC|nr:cytochrome P450 [Agromyces sp. Marseille-P2726]
MTSTVTSAPPAFPLVREDPLLPPADYVAWREEAPARQVTLQDGSMAWVVLRHAEVRQVLEDPTISRDPSVPYFPKVRAGQTFNRNDVLLNHMDPPLHGRFRKMLAPWFTLKRISALRGEIQATVDETIDRLLTLEKPVNFHREFSLVIPSKVICRFLGIDYEHHHDFERLSAVATSASATPEEFGAAVKELMGIVASIVDEQVDNPGDGIVGVLATKYKNGEITREQALSHVHVLIVGGHETTAHTISQGMLLLWRNPDVLERLREHPEDWVKAINEMLRIHSVADGTMTRVTTAEIDLGGVTVPANQGIIPVMTPANFDPRAWENPTKFDIDRETTNHVSLGGGIHSCLGQNLARAELELAFETLVRRVPTLELAVPEEEVVFTRDGFVYGVRDMPVTW